MRLNLCMCFVFVFVCSADGQLNPCDGVEDFGLCQLDWTCDLEVSRCFCKSQKPYCRCNNYIDEFYLGKSCSQKWTTLTFALVATLPGVVLAFVIGISVHLVHRFGNSNKIQGAGNELTYIPEQNLFPGITFVSDLKSEPSNRPLHSPTPYSSPNNGQFLSCGPLVGISQPQYSAPDNTQSAFNRPPLGLRPSSPTVSIPDRTGPQPYSYAGGGAQNQVISNPYARARNPYEEPSVFAEPYTPPASLPAYEEQRMVPPPAPPHSTSEYCSVLPRAQISRLY